MDQRQSWWETCQNNGQIVLAIFAINIGSMRRMTVLESLRLKRLRIESHGASLQIPFSKEILRFNQKDWK